MERKVEKLPVEIMLLLLSENSELCDIFHEDDAHLDFDKYNEGDDKREMMTCSKGRYSSSSTGGSSGPGLQQENMEIILMMITKIGLVG